MIGLGRHLPSRYGGQGEVAKLQDVCPEAMQPSYSKQLHLDLPPQQL